MKNIGVFGDSFAHRFNPRVRHDILDAKDNTQYMAKLLKVFPTWMEFIKDDTTSVTSLLTVEFSIGYCSSANDAALIMKGI